MSRSGWRVTRGFLQEAEKRTGITKIIMAKRLLYDIRFIRWMLSSWFLAAGATERDRGVL
jgi:hypothetical protein